MKESSLFSGLIQSVLQRIRFLRLIIILFHNYFIIDVAVCRERTLIYGCRGRHRLQGKSTLTFPSQKTQFYSLKIFEYYQSYVGSGGQQSLADHPLLRLADGIAGSPDKGGQPGQSRVGGGHESDQLQPAGCDPAAQEEDRGDWSGGLSEDCGLSADGMDSQWSWVWRKEIWGSEKERL